MLLEERSKRIVTVLMNNDTFISATELATALNVSRRSIYYELEKVNQCLLEFNIETIRSIRNKGYYLNTTQKSKIRSVLPIRKEEPVYSSSERQILILCTLLQNQVQVHVENLMELTFVSRNTLFNDLKLIRARLKKYGLELSYIQTVGYQFRGDTIQIRSLFLHYFMSARPILMRENFVTSAHFSFLDHQSIEVIYQELKSIERTLETEYVIGTLYSLATLMHVIIANQQNLVDKDLDIFMIETSTELALLKEKGFRLGEDDYRYFALHLLASRTQIENERVHKPEMQDVAQELVSEFERLAAIKFTLRSALIHQLALHLSISYYRYRYGIQYGNLLLERIKTEYKDVFELAYTACDILRKRLEVPVSESEAGYIALHFNSFIHNNRFHSEKFVIDIVCPAGVSTSAMMRSEIEQLSPKIRIGKQMSIRTFEDKGSNADLVVSTIKLKSDTKILVVDPILRKMDKDHILTMVGSYYISAENFSAEDVLSIINPYIKVRDQKEVTHKIHDYFNRSVEKKARLMLKDVLNTESIQIIEKSESWEQALAIAGAPLLSDGAIETRYIEKIIENTNAFGPYMVIADGYMLAHASFNDGTNRVALSFLKLEQAVKIGTKSCNKIFVISMIDQKHHLGIMRELMDIFNDEILTTLIDEAHTIAKLDSLLLG